MIDNISSNKTASRGIDKTPDSGVQISVPQRMVDTIVAEHGNELSLITSIASQYLQLGFDMSRVAGTSATTQDLQNVLDEGSHTLIHHHETQIEKVVELMNDIDKLVKASFEAENVALAKTLADAKKEFTDASSLLTDRDNVNSIPFTVAKEAQEQVTSAIVKSQQALDIAADGSVANKLFRMFELKLDELVAKQTAHRASLDEQTNAMREALGLQQKVDQAIEKSSGKGKTMEQVVGDSLAMLAGNFGDVVDNIGDKTDGIGNDKKGDHVLTVMLDKKPIGKIVFEDKAGTFTMSGPTSLPAQMADAVTNYNADISVGVVTAAGPKKLVQKGYQQVGSSGHIVVVDWQNQEMIGLEILYPIIREMVIVKHLTKAEKLSVIDSKLLTSICEDNLSKLSNFNKLKKNLRQTVALTAQNVADQLEVMQQELHDAFKRMLHAVQKKEDGS
jgi:hypothetical protein